MAAGDKVSEFSLSGNILMPFLKDVFMGIRVWGKLSALEEVCVLSFWPPVGSGDKQIVIQFVFA